jgi:hypothetical protein
MQLIEYKWETFGRKHHFIGCCMHFVNVGLIIAYISLSYFTTPDDNVSIVMLGLSVCYPFFYEGYQLTLNGLNYFQDVWNYADMSYILMSILNVYL